MDLDEPCELGLVEQALRAIEGTLAPPALRDFRTLLSRSGDFGARVVRLCDVDAELAIIASAREIVRRERVQNEPPPAS